MKKLLFVALLIWCGQCGLAGTQSTPIGKIKGVVVDQNDAILPSAKITITGKGRKWVLTPSPADGRFEAEVPTGTYDIKTEAYQFRTLKQKKIQVKAGAEIEQKFRLQVLPTKPQKCSRGPCL